MSVFGSYAKYYDLLYRDKDYVGEADYVARLLREFGSGDTLLELGCGTGKHSRLLTERGFVVTGIDRSDTMLAQARERAGDVVGPDAFVQADIRDFDLERRFDAVIALFHVVSYVISHEDLASLLACVRKHLKPGGVFLFDVWYGPAVLTLGPDVRVLRLEDASTQVTRLAEPVLHVNDNVVDVHYEIQVTNKADGSREVHHEQHSMRYLFRPELAQLLADAGMAIVRTEEWMTGADPSGQTWGVCFVAKG